MKLIIGSRCSALAVQQAEWVGSQLKKKNPDLEIEFKRITTTGDKNLDPSFAAVGTKGMFVKEVEEALLSKQIDLAVHSLKDVPQELPEGLILGPVPERQDPHDVLISRFGEHLHELPKHSIVGTSSPRRRAQVLANYGRRAYVIEPLRGNIDTRLKKLQAGEYDAIILAHAGLIRLGLESEITQVLKPEEMCPAACQGCLGLELREQDKQVLSSVQSIAHIPSDIAAQAERAFLLGLGGNCFVPVAVYSSIDQDHIHMKALLMDVDGKKSIRVEERGPIADSKLIGFQLAERLLYEGGSALMAELPR